MLLTLVKLPVANALLLLGGVGLLALTAGLLVLGIKGIGGIGETLYVGPGGSAPAPENTALCVLSPSPRPSSAPRGRSASSTARYLASLVT